MTKFIIEVDSPENADLFAKLLQTIDYVDNVETLDEETLLSMEQIAMLDERLEAIERGEMGFKTLEEVKKSIKEKYGI